VTNVALLSAAVAFLVARAAIRLEQRTVLFLALGFAALASFFTVHGFATPGVLAAVTSGQPLGYDAFPNTYTGTVIGHSAYLSLLAPAVLFAVSYSPAAYRFIDRVPARGAALVVALGVITYGVISTRAPHLITRSALSHAHATNTLAILSIGLFLYAAWRQFGIYSKTRLPMHGALVASFVLLAYAQVIMATSQFWTLAWWEYHVLMLAAVVLAIGSLFLELDRRRGLERFLSAEVVDRVVSGDLLRLSGERRVATVLFADLRGSTGIAENMEAESLVRMLNETVGVLAKSVFAHGGMLDKFLGDGVMAVFGVVPSGDAGATAATRAALDMREQIRRLNNQRAAARMPAVEFGVSVHTGELVLGAIGTPQRSEYTAVGDTVNTAARLQEVCKRSNVDIVLSGQTAERIDRTAFSLRPLGPMSLRGKSQPVEVFAIDA
jgi:class 3 adenylate cyclase